MKLKELDTRKVWKMFNIGDRVVVKIYGEDRKAEVVSIIKSDDHNNTYYGLRMNESSPLYHSLKGLVEPCRGWYALENNLKLESDI